MTSRGTTQNGSSLTTVSNVPPDGARREEILQTAASLFASAGLRTSLKEIADACGILPGSLYHHFDSKEAIIVELVQRYRDDLDREAKDALNALYEPTPRSVEDRTIEFGRAIASCGVQHRAALLLTLYEPPAVFGDEVAQLARNMPKEIQATMLELLRQGRSAGAIRDGVDLELLADRLCQSMLHVGVGVSHLTPGAENVPELRLRILLFGIARRARSNAALDRSSAFRAAKDVIATWDDETDGDQLADHLRSVARAEFGRRGYEATTMRDVAASAELSTGTVYRTFGSKDALLMSVMGSYWAKVSAAWKAVSRSPSSPLEKLDALIWVNVNVINRFSDEFKIQLAWLRQSPPSTPDLGFSFLEQLSQVKTLLAAGIRSGDLSLTGASADIRARCVFEAVMMPESIVRAAGTEGAQALARDTVIRGAVVPRRARRTS